MSPQPADANESDPGTRPDIVVILVDDLGYSDLGSYGGEIETPNLDRLAARGVRFSDFYTTPRCSPTRASLLTGRYSHEVGIGVLTRPVGYRGSLDPAVPTLATCLADAGYATGLTGKWHLSADLSAPNETWPTRRGFQDFYGILGGGTSYFNPQAFYHGEEPVSVPAEDAFYLTDAFTDHAVGFIRDRIAEQRPYFLYLAYTAPHWPLQAPEADIDAQRGRYDGGWDAARAARIERQRSLGLFAHDFAPSPRDAEETAWEDASDHEWQRRRMEVYAAQVAAMDRGVGRILDELEAAGTLENTLLLFLSDNGAEAEEIVAGRRFPPHVMPPETRAGEPVAFGNEPSVVPGAENTFTSYGRPWANLSNTPFRLYKKWVHEGGIAAPLLASWPAAGMDGGAIVHEPAHVIDLLPTIAAATGITIDDAAAGTDLLPLIGGDAAPERDLFWEHIGHGAVRRGRYKLVRERQQDWELYDLTVDRAEQHDLAAERPDLVAELAQAWQRWADDHGVIGWPELVSAFEERGLPAWQANS